MLTIKPDPSSPRADEPTAMDIDGPPVHVSIKPAPSLGGAAAAVTVELGVGGSGQEGGAREAPPPQAKSNGQVHIGPEPANAEAGGRQQSAGQ
jgi:hypothetical protein